jgi:hypothetical protein
MAALRFRWETFPSETRLRDFIVARVRHGIDDPKDRDRIAAEIKQHWQADPIRDGRAARYWQARAIEREIASMVADGKSKTDAMKIVAERYGHSHGTGMSSAQAFLRWLKRNLADEVSLDKKRL